MPGTVVIRPFERSDGKDVEFRLRMAWRMEIPKKFNLTQVIAEQPLGHAIVAICVGIFYIFFRELGTLCLAIPGFYIALYMVVLILFLFQADDLLLKELSDIPSSYKSPESGHFWVAEGEVDGNTEVVGTVGLLRRSEHLAQLRHLNVIIHQEEDRSVTKQLLYRSLNYAKSQGFSEVELLTAGVDIPLAKVLDRIGFHPKGKFYMPSKHLYILPMQTLHVKVEDMKLDDEVSSRTKSD